jgi:hypothetical protein
MRTCFSVWGLLLTLAPSLAAQGTRPAPAPAPAPLPLTDTPELRALRNLRWRAIGPANQAGRIPMVVGIHSA